LGRAEAQRNAVAGKVATAFDRTKKLGGPVGGVKDSGCG
jgi:hypothetical protein